MVVLGRDGCLKVLLLLMVPGVFSVRPKTDCEGVDYEALLQSYVTTGQANWDEAGF